MEFKSLSYSLSSQTPSYGNGAKPELELINSIKDGGTSNKTKIITDSHLGTHIDFPFHFIADGKTGNDYSASDFCFQSPLIIEVPINSGLIGNHELGQVEKNSECDLLLIKTGTGKYRYEEHYWKNGPGMAAETARFLKNKFPSLRAIGFDFISLTSFQHREEGRNAHREYLSRNILIIEDMKLDEIHSGTKINEIIIAPFLFENCDGAPVYVMAKINNV